MAPPPPPPHVSPLRKRLRKLLLRSAGVVAVVVVVGIPVLEGIGQMTTQAVTQPQRGIGWRTRPNLDFTLPSPKGQAAKLRIHYQTNAAGARTAYSAGRSLTATTPQKILVIGDALTMAPWTSNDQAWFAAFARRWAALSGTSVMVSAIGATGFGTLQEWMATYHFLQTYGRPDIVLVQFCADDYAENTDLWPRPGDPRAQVLRRPYLNGDLSAIVYKRGPLATLYRSRLGHSTLFTTLDHWLSPQAPLPSAPQSATALAVPEPLQATAFRITQTLLTRLRNSAESQPAYIFNCSPWKTPQQEHQWRTLAETAGFNVLSKAMAAVQTAADQGKPVFAANGLPATVAGQDVLGTALAQELFTSYTPGPHVDPVMWQIP